MLKVASFAIGDADGINNLLSEHRLASGAHILVSDGQVCIPYEDGEPETKAQKLVILKEQINTLRKELDFHIHSQKVNDLTIEDLKKEVAAKETPYITKTNDKETEKIFKLAQGKLTEFENLQKQGQAEILRITRNIDLFEEQIKELNG